MSLTSQAVHGDGFLYRILKDFDREAKEGELKYAPGLAKLIAEKKKAFVTYLHSKI